LPPAKPCQGDIPMTEHSPSGPSPRDLAARAQPASPPPAASAKTRVTGAQALVQALERAGADVVFGHKK